jgi:4-hydroxybenzoate polyprenyltransferase
MIHFIKIIRPLNLLIIIACIFLSSLIIQNKISYNIIPIALIITLLAAFANIINDIIDYKIDQANNLDRPIASGEISQKLGLIYAVILILFILFIILFYEFSDLTIKLIFFINVPLILVYTPLLKRIPLLGNLSVAFNLAMVFLITAIHLNGINNLKIIFPPTILAFLLMLIREIVKDIADLEGDKKFNIATFPVQFGIHKSFLLIIILSIILICTVFYIYIYHYHNIEYLILICVFIIFPLLYHLYEFSKNKTSTYCIYLAKVLKLITIFGVIVIYLASKF